MKAIITLIFVLFIGISVQSQTVKTEVKVATFTAGTETKISQDVLLGRDNSVARLYMFKNSRIKRELSFQTKLNKAKLA